MNPKEHQRFEKWAKSYHLLLFRSGNNPDEYRMLETQMAWLAWQARAKDPEVEVNSKADTFTFWTQERTDFELWAVANGWFINRIGNGPRYVLEGTQIAWHAWQSALTRDRNRIAPLVQIICDLLEMADNRAMATDGPINNDGAFNELGTKEKRQFCKCCNAIRKLHGDT